MDEKLKALIIPPKEQKQDGFFRMRMKYDVSLVDKELLDIFKNTPFGVPEGSATISVEQTVSFIPDDDAIRRYEEAIVGSMVNERAIVTKAHFTGYDYLYAVKLEPHTGSDQEM